MLLGSSPTRSGPAASAAGPPLFPLPRKGSRAQKNVAMSRITLPTVSGLAS
jgi:hypothetical protein